MPLWIPAAIMAGGMVLSKLLGNKPEQKQEPQKPDNEMANRAADEAYKRGLAEGELNALRRGMTQQGVQQAGQMPSVNVNVNNFINNAWTQFQQALGNQAPGQAPAMPQQAAALQGLQGFGQNEFMLQGSLQFATKGQLWQIGPVNQMISDLNKLLTQVPDFPTGSLPSPR